MRLEDLKVGMILEQVKTHKLYAIRYVSEAYGTYEGSVAINAYRGESQPLGRPTWHLYAKDLVRYRVQEAK